MPEFCWIILCVFIFFVLVVFMAFLPYKEIDVECKGNPRYKKGAIEHKKVPYKMELKLYGGIPFYVVYYKCKYCGQEYRPIRYRREDLKGERLFKYSKELDLYSREVILEK